MRRDQIITSLMSSYQKWKVMNTVQFWEWKMPPLWRQNMAVRIGRTRYITIKWSWLYQCVNGWCGLGVICTRSIEKLLMINGYEVWCACHQLEAAPWSPLACASPERSSLPKPCWEVHSFASSVPKIMHGLRARYDRMLFFHTIN